MKGFISCDWGSTALRTRIVDAEKQSVLVETVSDQGISATFTLWKQSGSSEESRLIFYLNILKNQIDILERQSGFSLKQVDLVISGMASSNIGMMELPYKEVPFHVDGSDLHVKMIQISDDFRYKILLISGAKTQNDVMRGEETQLVGCDMKKGRGERIFIFPGTHSKHILIKDNKAIDFKTYMTGEFFSLLTKNSILSNNVEVGDCLLESDALKNFEEGVANSLKHNLLHASFLARTNGLFNRNTKKENYFYLSGLLIGTELKDLVIKKTPITLVSNETQKIYYFAAFQKLGIEGVQFQDTMAATIRGQSYIYNNYNKTLSKS